MLWFVPFLLFCLPVHAQTTAEKVAAIAEASPAVQRGSWGIQVLELETGAVVFERNPANLFIPASTVKLFTTALALRRLGPEHRFRTVVLADSLPGEDGVLRSDLRLTGGGDPTLSGRPYPYAEGAAHGDPLGPLHALADQVVARGVRAVDGRVIGDDTAYPWEPYPTGWAQEDVIWEYGAPVSALTLHDNAFRLIVRPGGGSGEPAAIEMRPPIGFYTVRNRVVTIASGSPRAFLDRPLAASEIDVWGTVRQGASGRGFLLAIRDPAHYAAWAFAEALKKRGVLVTGEAEARHRPLMDVPDYRRAPAPAPRAGEELAARESPPLAEVLPVVNKASQNLHAELVLREVGRVRRNIGSRAAGLDEMKQFLAGIGVTADDCYLEDASGLSRVNLVSPAAAVKLLAHMHGSEEKDVWLQSLSVGGRDGTLNHRYRSAPARGRVIAKTGTLSHVSALAGYIQRADGRWLAFAVFVNNYGTRSSVARKFIDDVVGVFLQAELAPEQP